MRFAFLVMASLLFAAASPAKAQQSSVSAVVDAALKSGDGVSSDTAFEVPGLLWAYFVLDRLHLRFIKQYVDQKTAGDVVIAFDPKAGLSRPVWFHALVPKLQEQAEMDRLARAILTSGDGLGPETAFTVGGYIDFEYQIMRFMRIETDMQALVSIRGCTFDLLTGHDVDTNEQRKIYFKLGWLRADSTSECVLKP